MLHLGDTEDPAAGSVLDRITSEGRLAPVVALGRGELSQVEFTTIVQHMLFESQKGQSTGGIEVEKLPFFGTALEAFYPTAYLGLETGSQFFVNTLRPLSEAWYEVADDIGLPAAGATGIANGFGQFIVFGHSPAEGVPPQGDAPVSIPPAAGMLAGALGGMAALDNLLESVMALQGAGLFDPNFGVPNYHDFGSGLVDETDPVYGTLEIAQMAVAIMNRMLAGGTLQFYLTRDPMFNNATLAYFGQMNSREAEFRPSGDGMEIVRTAAGGDAVWHLEDPGDLVEYDVNFAFAASLSLFLRYSNAGPGDMITVLVNGAPVGTIATMTTGDFNMFVTAPQVPLGLLPAGPVTIGLRLETTDGDGVDLDRFRIAFPQPGEPEGESGEGEYDGNAPLDSKQAALQLFIPVQHETWSDRETDEAEPAPPSSAVSSVIADRSPIAACRDDDDAPDDNSTEASANRTLDDWIQSVDAYFADFA